MGYFTRLLFLGDDRVLCGATGGTLLAFRTADGELIRTWRLPTTSSIADLAVSAEGAIWLVLGDGQVIAIPPADV